MASPEEALTVTQTAPGPRRGPRAGAGWIRPVLAGLGAFLLVFGLLLRLYVAPRLIAAPAGFYIVVTLADPHASYFDESTLTTRRDVTLTYNDTIRGDAGASTGTIAVWDQFTVLADRKRNVQLIATFQRSAFNRRTGELSNCCGASVNDDTQVRQDGIGVVFWPIGTRQTTYQVYDTNTERAWPAAYSGTAYVQGLLTYRFTQRIPVTVVQQLPGVPTSLLGLRGPSRNVVANRTFQATNTFWVDPRTGVPVNVEERILSTLHAPGGQGRLMVANADLTMTSASQRALAAVARQNAAAITTVRQEGPLGGLLLGLLLLLAGTVPLRQLRRVGSAKRGALQSLAAEDDDAREGAVAAWRGKRDFHRGEVARVDGARHGEGPASAARHEERAGGGHLPMLWADVPAFVPLASASASPMRASACDEGRPRTEPNGHYCVGDGSLREVCPFSGRRGT